MDQRDGFAAPAPVHSEIVEIGCNQIVGGVELAHSDEAQIGQVRLPVLIAGRQFRQARNVLGRGKRDPNQAFVDKIEDRRGAAELVRRFGQHRFAR